VQLEGWVRGVAVWFGWAVGLSIAVLPETTLLVVTAHDV